MTEHTPVHGTDWDQIGSLPMAMLITPQEVEDLRPVDTRDRDLAEANALIDELRGENERLRARIERLTSSAADAPVPVPSTHWSVTFDQGHDIDVAVHVPARSPGLRTVMVAQSKIADRIERATRAATVWNRPSPIVDNSHVLGFGASDRRSKSFEIVLSQLPPFLLSPRVMVIHCHDRNTDPIATPWESDTDGPTRFWDVLRSRLALADFTLITFGELELERRASGLHNLGQQFGLVEVGPAKLEAEYLTCAMFETCAVDMVGVPVRALAAGSSPAHHHDAHSH